MDSRLFGKRYAAWGFVIVGVLAAGFIVRSWPREDPPALRVTKSYAALLAAAAVQYRELTGDWPESLNDLPPAAIRAANSTVPAEHSQRAIGGDCDEGGTCSVFESLQGYRITYFGHVWPGRSRPIASRTCADAREPRLTVKSYHGRPFYWTWQRSEWQTSAYGELMPTDWGFAAVSDSIAWAIGDRGIYAITHDGGRTCRFGQVENLSDRALGAIAPISRDTLYVLSEGNDGRPPARIYQTVDGGSTWHRVYESDDLVFLTFAFWDTRHGVVIARDAVVDPTSSRRYVLNPLLVLTTRDGGKSWQQQKLPLLRDEFPKLRSLALLGSGHAWFATYAEVDSVSRLFRTVDRGRTWSVVTTSSKPGVGIDLVTFRDSLNGVALGCGYLDNGVMRTSDGGRSWSVKRSQYCGISSELEYVTVEGRPFLTVRVDDRLLYSRDDGKSWTAADSTLYRGITRVQPWRRWIEREGGWATRWAGKLAAVNLRR